MIAKYVSESVKAYIVERVHKPSRYHRYGKMEDIRYSPSSKTLLVG